MDDLTIEMARTGDRAAQERVLHGLQDRWYRICVGLLGRTDLAAEAVQECAVRMLSGLRNWRGESRFSTWAIGIAVNVCREMQRRPRLAERRTLAESPSPDRAAELAENVQIIRELLAEMPDRQREAVVLRYFEDLSIEQAAAAMGCAPGTIKATVFQALRRMRDALREKV